LRLDGLQHREQTVAMANPALFKFALAALLSLWPAAIQSKHFPGPKPDAPAIPMTPTTADDAVLAYCLVPSSASHAVERRVCRVAREIAAAVEEHAAQDRIPFAGPAAQEATTLALIEIARHESGFRAKVEDCRITGDLPTRHSKITEGLAISLFQLQANSREDLFEMTATKPPRHRRYSREAVCKSNALAAKLALHALMRAPWVQRASTRPASVASMFHSYASGKPKKTKAGTEHIEAFEAMVRDNGLRFVPAKGSMWVEAIP
jgi:hypothetical protein